MDIKKRGEGVNKNCLGLRQMYKFYCENYDSPVNYSEYAKIIKACNIELIRVITEESEEVKLPYRLGTLQVCKFERSYDQPKNKWKIDWKKTKEQGFTVYHDQKYIYKWMWKKHHSVVKNKTGYKFKPSRRASRIVPKLLATKKHDYFK